MNNFRDEKSCLLSLYRWAEGYCQLTTRKALNEKVVFVDGRPYEVIVLTRGWDHRFSKEIPIIHIRPVWVNIKNNQWEGELVSESIPQILYEPPVSNTKASREYDGYIFHPRCPHYKDPFDRSLYREEIREML